MSVRTFVARSLGPLVVWPLARRLTASEPRALMYHRFSDAPMPRRTNAASLRRHLEVICERYEPVTFQELARRAARGQLNGGRPPVALTVDDGYRDFYQHAFPVLRSAGVPATVFVTAGFVENRLWLWHDAVEHLIFNTHVKHGELHFRGSTMHLELTNPAARRKSWQDVAALVQNDTHGREELLPLLEQTLDIKLPARTTAEYEAMTWNEIKELSDHGIEIGGHTWTHAFLPDLPDEQLREELAGSRSLLEQKIGRPVNTFAYPNGLEEDVTERVRDAVAAAGYEAAAVATVPAPRAPFDLMRIGRWSPYEDLVNLQNILSGTSSLVSRFSAAS
jgi:peptidoglycan/xylan/chitin deacetylase (PgdA/CDA1 family)